MTNTTRIAILCAIIAFFMVGSCSNEEEPQHVCPAPIHDTVDRPVLVEVWVLDTLRMDSMANVLAAYKQRNKSLAEKLYWQNIRIDRVKYYMAIIDKRPDQIVFARGWFRRALDTLPPKK